MSLLALVFLVVYAAPVVRPDLTPGAATAFQVAAFAIWLLFGVDLIIRAVLADRPLHYLARNPVDVPAVFLPMLRPLRALRVFAGGHSLLTRRGGLVRTGRAVLVSALILIVIGAVSVLDAEQGDPQALIKTFPDALWWSITTVTTVGYGDLYPVTSTGRAVAAMLMLVGISVVGVLTAGATTWFVGPRPDVATARDVAAGRGPGRDDSAALAALLSLHHDGVLSDAEVAAAVSRLGRRTNPAR